MGVRLLGCRGGGDETTSGSVRLFSALSIRAIRPAAACRIIGGEYKRAACRRHVLHGAESEAWPMGKFRTKAP